MEIARVNGADIEYEVKGSGEPVLLIEPVVADAFLPFMSAKPLADYRLIRYHKSGWCGSTHTPGLCMSDYAKEADALLEELGVTRAHVVGHSSGADVALQLALDYPDRVHSLALLEPGILSVPSAQSMFERAGPAMAAYGAGDHRTAVESFFCVVSGLDRDSCVAALEKNAPGAVAATIKDADTLFGVEFPAVTGWTFGPEQAARIQQPILSVRGTKTDPVWVEVDQLLHTWFPEVEGLSVPGAGHMLQMQNPEPVARGIAEFFARHPMKGG
jgi:pimeloyl-ACP methyl ester carboxylesterase